MEKTKLDKETLDEAIWELQLGYTSYIPRKMRTRHEEKINGQGYENGINSAIEMLKKMQKKDFVPFREGLNITKKQMRKHNGRYTKREWEAIFKYEGQKGQKREIKYTRKEILAIQDQKHKEYQKANKKISITIHSGLILMLLGIILYFTFISGYMILGLIIITFGIILMLIGLLWWEVIVLKISW